MLSLTHHLTFVQATTQAKIGKTITAFHDQASSSSRHYKRPIWMPDDFKPDESLIKVLQEAAQRVASPTNRGHFRPSSESTRASHFSYPTLLSAGANNANFMLANSQSSRNHGMVTIKVLRGHRGDRDDPSSLQISRLTLVDLTGSEQTKHTQTTGDHLKEARNINEYLMVLGGRVMRSNQKCLAQSLANPGWADTCDVKRVLAVVPLRHSKFTEVLMDYFVGDGRVVMIVNIDYYDTGFEENSHVIKFSALARDVSTTVNNAPVSRVQINPSKRSTVGSAMTRKRSVQSEWNSIEMEAKEDLEVSFPKPFDLASFLAATMIFMSTVENAHVFFDNKVFMKINKSGHVPSPIRVPKDVVPRSKEGTMNIKGVSVVTQEITVERTDWARAVGTKLKKRTDASQGQSTAQTTGIGGHMSGRFIPTAE
ncbi:kinesin motor domain-containing protein [Suillus lakei]|nr:kinesin motor domain-containing protein [Suillus lakei]